MSDIMDVVVNNFYLMDQFGNPEIICENYESNESIIDNKIFQLSIARVAKHLEDQAYKLEYRDVVHYITNLKDHILVLGFKVVSGSKEYFIATMNLVVEYFNFRIYNLEDAENLDHFDHLADIIITQLFDKFDELSQHDNVQLEMKLGEAIKIA